MTVVLYVDTKCRAKKVVSLAEISNIFFLDMSEYPHFGWNCYFAKCEKVFKISFSVYLKPLKHLKRNFCITWMKLPYKL